MPNDLELVEFDTHSAGTLLAKRVAVRKNGLIGFLDENGTMVIPPMFARSDWFSEGIALCAYDDVQYVIDLEGNVISGGKGIRKIGEGVWEHPEGVIRLP